MSKILNAFLLALVIAASPLVTLAHETGEAHEHSQIEDKRIDQQAQIKDRLDNLERMFDLRVDWLASIIARLESRITKLEANNVNTADAKAKLAAAKTALEVAKNKIAPVIYDLAVALSSDTPRQAFKEAKPAAQQLSDEIKAVHQQLVEVITMLKSAVAN